MQFERLETRNLLSAISINAAVRPDHPDGPLGKIFTVGDQTGDGIDDLYVTFEYSIDDAVDITWHGGEMQVGERFNSGLEIRRPGPGFEDADGDGVDDFLDINGDGIRDEIIAERGRHAQFQYWIELGEPETESLRQGDANGSGSVDFADFLILSNNFGNTDAAFADGDFDASGTVDFADFLILSQNFGE